MKRILCKLGWHTWTKWVRRDGMGARYIDRLNIPVLVDTVELRKSCVRCTKTKYIVASHLPSEEHDLNMFLETLCRPMINKLNSLIYKGFFPLDK